MNIVVPLPLSCCIKITRFLTIFVEGEENGLFLDELKNVKQILS